MVDYRLSKEFLYNMFRQMFRIRYCEEELVAPILNREVLTPCHLCSGQEGVTVGICSTLNSDDYIFGNHRSHGHFLAKGGSIQAMLAEIFCKESGCSCGLGGSMHLIDPEVGMLGSAPIVAGTISLAVGAALAASIRRDGRVAVSFFGDGATGEGALYESLNFAALKKLPVIFACENNLYATHMPIGECRVDQPISKVAEPFCIPIYTVDGNDVLAVFEASKSAVETCRKGEGPVFMEFMTYRLRGHVGPDDNIQGTHTDIRPEKEVDAWRLKDPILRLEKHLEHLEPGAGNALAEIKAQVKAEVDAAVAFARESAFPDPEDLLKFVFKS